jgi:hypothetical protein
MILFIAFSSSAVLPHLFAYHFPHSPDDKAGTGIFPQLVFIAPVFKQEPQLQGQPRVVALFGRPRGAAPALKHYITGTILRRKGG